MVQRNAERLLRELAGYYPVVTLTGPRQSGKTTLVRSVFAHLPYVNLEPLDVREAARSDPRRFLDAHPRGVVLDEIQHAPDLLSYLQVKVDEDRTPGRFILTGSQHFGLTSAVSQSLAGRSGVMQLLPPSYDELQRFDGAPTELFEVLVAGAYPPIHDRHIPPPRWHADYFTTYVQRDVREVLRIGDLEAFTTFVRLLAGRTAQELNLSSLAGDAGITHPTARAWISVLEAGYLCFRVPAWHANVRKRLVKAPKLHFYDSGLVCHLLGIQTAEQLRTHPLRGAIFESWVASEQAKRIAHEGLNAHLHHLRAVRGLEVDLIVATPEGLALVEAKSGATVTREAVAQLEDARTLVAASPEGARSPAVRAFLVHGGAATERRGAVEVVPWTRAWGVGAG